MSITIKVLTDLFDNSINDFYNRFHKANRTKEAFQWEFIDTATYPAVYIHAIDENHNIVGAIAVLFYEMINGKGEKILTGKPEDVMLDISASLKHRKTDIFKELYQTLEKICIEKEVLVLWGFTYADSTFKRLGFESKYTSKNGVFVLKPLLAYKYLTSLNKENSITDKSKIAIFTCLSFFYRFKIFFTSKNIKGSISIDDIKNHNQLLINHLENDQYCIFQDDNFINWRLYKNKFDVVYKSISLKDESGKQIAELIYSIRMNVAFIEQILFDKHIKENQLISFAKKAVLIIKNEKVAIIRHMGFDSNIYNKKEINLLNKLGFIFTNKGIPVIMKKIGSKPLNIGTEDIFFSRLYTQGNL